MAERSEYRGELNRGEQAERLGRNVSRMNDFLGLVRLEDEFGLGIDPSLVGAVKGWSIDRGLDIVMCGTEADQSRIGETSARTTEQFLVSEELLTELTERLAQVGFVPRAQQ